MFRFLTFSFFSFPFEASNRLELLKRRPSDLRRYLAWSADIKATYGAMTNFVVKERLHWEPNPTNSPDDGLTFFHMDQIPFAHEDDFKILRNDWPYGVAPNVTHLVVWTKAPIATGDDGDVTPESRRIIEDFVDETFAGPLDALFGEGKGRENVLWFKNWVSEDCAWLMPCVVNKTVGFFAKRQRRGSYPCSSARCATALDRRLDGVIIDNPSIRHTIHVIENPLEHHHE